MIHIKISEINDMVYALKETTSAQNALITLQEFIDSVQVCTYSQLIEILQEHARQFALSNGLCPSCTNDLHVETWDEPRGEYLGEPVKERMAELVCSDCGFRE